MAEDATLLVNMTLPRLAMAGSTDALLVACAELWRTPRLNASASTAQPLSANLEIGPNIEDAFMEPHTPSNNVKRPNGPTDTDEHKLLA
jgi:hypothetical protein